jgi:hypothetical protein
MNDDPEKRGFDPKDYRATARLKGKPIMFEEKLKQWTERDLPQAKDQEKYKGMVAMFSMAEDKEMLKGFSMWFITDMRYERADICLALHTVEMARGWHC